MKLFEKDISIPPFQLPKKDGYSWYFEKESKTFHIDIPNGKLIYVEHYLSKKDSDYTMDYLLDNEKDWRKQDWKNVNPEIIKWKNIKWRQDKIKLFGKRIPIPRFSAWYADEGKNYSYSGLTLQPNEWNTGLLFLKKKINTLANTNFNSVLLNWYRDGADHMSWHADDEKELGRNPIIGSVNLGATRRFVFRRIDNKKEKVELLLKHGTFLIMAGEIQHYWQHAIPKTKKVKTTRINLTFRVIV